MAIGQVFRAGEMVWRRRPVHGEQDWSCRIQNVVHCQPDCKFRHLRCFQFISPETIPYGRFCWNQDCQYCRVTCQLPDEDEPHEMLSCKFIVMPGMEITELSQELKWCLRAKLPADTAVSS